jgi:hypothetical protein
MPRVAVAYATWRQRPQVPRTNRRNDRTMTKGSSTGSPPAAAGRGLAGVGLLCWLAFAAAAVAEEFVLDLPGGGQLPGRFEAVAEPAGPLQTLAWRSDSFAEPFAFRLAEITGVRGSAGGVAVDAGGFNCRLRGGDLIVGDLRRIDEKAVVIAPAGGPPLTIERAGITGLSRRKAGGTAGFVGPGGLAGWKQSPASSWVDQAGRIAGEVPNAMVSRDLGGPARARYDIVLGWQTKPELVIAVAAGRGSEPDPFRFEMLNLAGGTSAAMLVRHEQERGMLEPIPLPGKDAGRLRLTLFVDQQRGRLAAAVPGQEVVELAMPAAGRPPSGEFRLRLISGDVRLEGLRVSAWTSAEPFAGDPNRTRVSRRDGRVLEAETIAVAEGGEVVVRSDGGETTFPLDDLEEIAFGGPGAGLAAAGGDGVRLVGRTGVIVSGPLVAVDQDGLAVLRAGIDRPVRVAEDELESLVSLTGGDAGRLPGRRGTIRVGEAECTGCLIDAAPWGGGIAWLPRGSETASPLAGSPAEVAAVVEYVARAEVVTDVGGQVEVGGIGAAVDQEGDGGFVLTMLSEAGAAARDGRIQVGDRVVAVRPIEDGPFVDTEGLDLAMVMNLMRGRVGTPVSLRITRERDGRPKRIDLTRGLIYVADRSVLDEALAAHASVATGQFATVGAAAGFPSLLVLRSGDVVNAAIDRIDDDGIRLRTPVTAARGEEEICVPHRLVRAVELDPRADSRTITPDQFTRLLTLPRSQRDSPPTHLLRLRSGDYLRCDLEQLAADAVRFTLLGRSKELPREAIVRIIWLQPDEIDFGDEAPADEPAAEPQPAEGLVVQGIAADGGRTTLLAERMEGPVIIGTSLAFGTTRVDTQAIDRLLIGRAVTAEDGELPFARWRLRLAPLPRAVRPED